jgi:carbon-monoxide dehydrogenase small subunit
LRIPLSVTVNGRARELLVDTRQTLASLVRDTLGLTGTHIGCKTGHCGACTVELDGLTVKSCCVLAAEVDGCSLTTIEAIGQDGLHPVQRAFAEHQGLQCGFCTPGMIMSTLALLRANPEPSDDDIRLALAGNLCRCTGYQLIFESVHAAAQALR